MVPTTLTPISAKPVSGQSTGLSMDRQAKAVRQVSLCFATFDRARVLRIYRTKTTTWFFRSDPS
jgi:hypothetical protein